MAHVSCNDVNRQRSRMSPRSCRAAYYVAVEAPRPHLLPWSLTLVLTSIAGDVSMRNKVSRHEHSARVLEALLAHEVIFGVPPRALFAGDVRKGRAPHEGTGRGVNRELTVHKVSRLTTRKIEVLSGHVSQREDPPYDFE